MKPQPNILSEALGFVHERTQRTGYVTDGPWGTYDREVPRENGRMPYVEGSVFYAVKWDDTGEDGEAYAHEIRWIPKSERHITDGIRVCHCGPATIGNVVTHRGKEDLN